ncbi:MAG: beta strand repeat-containing protein [Phycisphaerales bacterium]
MSKLSWLFGGSDSKTTVAHERKPLSARRSPADLLRRAGYADEPAFEQLEERKLMFNLVVDPADPTFVDLGGGIGQVTADFGYISPFLQREVPAIVALPSDTVTYDQVPIGNIASGTILRPQPTDPFGLRITHAGFTANQVRVQSIGVAPADTPRALAVDITSANNRTITFEALNGTIPRLMQEFIFVTTGTGGFNAGSQIELIRNGVVQQTLNFAQIDATRITDPGTGNNTYTIGQPGGVVFDQIRISRAAAGTTQLRFIETDPVYPAGRFGEFMEGLVFGARMVLTGRIGATATVLDLYGRDMTRTINLGRTADNPDGVALVDLDDNGVPDFNDGIGRIVLTNTDSATQLLITGGTLQAITSIEEFLGADAVEEVPVPPALNPGNFFGLYLPGNPVAGGGGGGGGQVTPMSGLAGFYDDAGFGFGFDNTGDIIGLGNSIGSVIIGSPFIRNNSGATPQEQAVNYHGVDPSDPNVTQPVPSTLPQVRPQQVPANPTPANFGLADVVPGNPASLSFSSMLIENNLPGVPNPFLRQGIFAAGTVGDMYVNGMLFGSSQFDGVIGNMAVGTLYGSLRVEGDASSLYVGSDAGTFIAFRNNQLVPVATGSQVVFGRAVGNINIGATNRATFQVLGDTLNPARPVGDFLNYDERENVIPVNPQTQNQEYILQGSISASGPILFDGQTYRNDGINGAEFVGSGLRGAVITGVLGLLNGQPHENTAGEDAADVFAFAAGVGQAVTISVSWTGAQNGDRNYARIVDSTGRVLAAPQFPFLDPNSQVNGGDFNSARFTFTPTGTGVYYLVLGSQINGQNEQGPAVVTYTATLTGQLPVILGSFTAAGGNRADFIRVANGDVGLLRYGTGIQQPDGTVRITPETSIDAAADELEQADIAGSSINVAGNLYEIIFGGTIIGANGGLTMAVGGNLGHLTTGFNIGADGEQGDLQAADITVGGSIGLLDISGSIGYQTQATTNRPGGAAGPVTIRTGGPGVPGNIGQIRVGNLVNGQVFTLVTSANSVIERFDLGTRSTGANSGQFVVSQPTLSLGAGSDIRFTNFTQTPYQVPGQATNPDLFIPLNFNTPIVVTDDNGGQIRINITGTGTGPAGTLRILPFNGPNSGPIGAIELTNFGISSQLIITALTTNTSIDIGSIAFLGGAAAGGANAAIRISGPGTVNVRDIVADGTTFSEINNLSPGGDFVTITVAAVNRVNVAGDLGFANYITSERGDGVFLNTGQTTVPVRWIESGNATDEDLGAPDLSNLNGIFIGGGTTALVSVNGRLGDVWSLGTLTQVTANADGFTPSGQFNGVEGVLFATNIRTVDIGDGLRGWGESPFATAGIFATGHIAQVLGGARVRNPVIAGAIIAQGQGPAIPGFQPGIGSIILSSGRIDGAYIGGAEFQSAWASVRFSGVRQFLSADPPVATTNINSITLTNATMSRSTLFARAVRTISITGGAWDANNLEARAVANAAPIGGLASGTITSISADRFTNTTLDGEPLEARYNQIRAGGSVTSIRTNNPTIGDFSDIFIDVVNSVGTLSGRNFSRVRTNIGTNLTTITANGDIRNSIIGAGRLGSATAANVRQSSFNISGPITTITVSNIIADSVITSDGPNGGITSISALNGINANISSSGIISTITSARGDISGAINTTDASDGSVTSIMSGRDMNATLNILRNLGTITATGNIGRRLVDGTTPDSITVAGTLGGLTASSGTIYSDVTVGGAVTGAITAGRAAFALPTNDWVSDARIIAGGRIASITWNGDFGGQFRSNSGGIGSIRVVNGSIRNLGRDANGAPVNSVQVGDGDLTSLSITRGHLLGSVAVLNGSLTTLSITGDAVFGNIGISPALSVNSAVGVPASEGRNQLPPGAVLTAGQDGPTIFVSRDLTSLTVGGGIFESGIIVGHNLGTVTVLRGTDNVAASPPSANSASFIVAADAITSVAITQGAVGLFVGSGVLTLGDDFRPGGTGSAADTNKSGTIGTFRAATTTDVTIEAGIIADAAGSYTGATATVTDGLSTITSVTVPGTNTANNTVVRADVQPTAASIRLNGAGNVVDGGQLLASDPRVATTNPGVQILAPNSIITVGAVQARVTLTGPGTIFYDQATRQITLRNTTAGSSLRLDPLVVGTPVNLSGLVIRTWDDASLASLTATANVTLSGATDIYVDGNITTTNFQALNNVTGIIQAGGNMTTITVGTPALALNQTNSARFVAQNVTSAIFTGTFGNGANSGLVARNLGTFSTTGAFGGRLSSDFDITTFRAGTDLAGGVRAGYNITSVSAVTMTNARVSAGGNIGTVTTSGTATASTGVSGTFIGAGADLGRDASFGGTGANADTVSNGNLGPVTIGGNFVSSDIAAGVLRGATAPSIGLSTDRVADGRSAIGTVLIRGTQVGTLSGSQQFRIISNGTIGAVTVGTQTNFQFAGNFRVQGYGFQPVPIQVTDLRLTQAGGIYQARITFNQAIDASTLSTALSIAEIRPPEPIATQFPLVFGTDYTVSYDPNSLIATVTFSQTVTSRALVPTVLPDATLPNAAAPGVFRFTLDASILRGQASSARLDGNADAAPNDNYVNDIVVGDAGDRFSPFITGPGNAPTSINFYSPVDLNLLMDTTQANNAPTINRPYTLRGILGDHPNSTSADFSASSDVDLFTVTLQAGQIIRLGALGGTASAIAPTIVSADAAIAPLGADVGGALLALPASTPLPGQTGAEQAFLVRVSGTYGILLCADPATFQAAGSVPGETVLNSADVINLPPIAGAVGDYAFTVTVFDDGNTGFAGTTSNNGQNIPTSPLPSAFQGPTPFGSGRARLATDLPFINSDGFTWVLEPGANNFLNGNGTATVRSDDIIRGTNAAGAIVERRAGTDGIFSNAVGSDDVYSVVGNIGDPGAVGGGTFIQSDVDIYNLNNGATITAGDRYRVTLRVTDGGWNLGRLPADEVIYAGIRGSVVTDRRGQVQLGIFDTSAATNITNGRLIAAPQASVSIGGTPNTVLADSGDGLTRYGYDARGDFYIEFTAPPRQDNTAQDANIALYVQGVNRSRYQLDIQSLSAAVPPVPAQTATQNFYIETNGAVINWLETGGRPTILDAYNGSVNGFQGFVGGVPVDEYIITNLLQSLRDIFAAVPGFVANTADADGSFGTIGNIRISTNVSDFDGQEYSSVFLAGNVGPPAFFNNGTFGAVQRVDAFNANHRDQAVVFAPAFNALGNPSNQAGIDNFINQLSAAMSRRMGELMGVRITANTGAGANTDLMAANSPTLALNSPAQQFRFVNGVRALSPRGDSIASTDFFLGTEADQTLLQRIFAVP